MGCLEPGDLFHLLFAGDKGSDMADDLIRCGLINKVLSHSVTLKRVMKAAYYAEPGGSNFGVCG